MLKTATSVYAKRGRLIFRSRFWWRANHGEATNNPYRDFDGYVEPVADLLIERGLLDETIRTMQDDDFRFFIAILPDDPLWKITQIAATGDLAVDTAALRALEERDWFVLRKRRYRNAAICYRGELSTDGLIDKAYPFAESISRRFNRRRERIENAMAKRGVGIKQERLSIAETQNSLREATFQFDPFEDD